MKYPEEISEKQKRQLITVHSLYFQLPEVSISKKAPFSLSFNSERMLLVFFTKAVSYFSYLRSLTSKIANFK
ncbi:hypothetical protein BLGI_3018 [Brevibacillus laterosporus GI-9]|nr:hypothetical protein BLGI_3018 [Brevibacillus laterosporus GI-9]